MNALKNFIDKTSERAGTPINREAMMAIQGFQASEVVFRTDGTIVETNADGHKLIISYDETTQTINKQFIADGKGITLETTLGFSEAKNELY